MVRFSSTVPLSVSGKGGTSAGGGFGGLLNMTEAIQAPRVIGFRPRLPQTLPGLLPCHRAEEGGVLQPTGAGVPVLLARGLRFDTDGTGVHDPRAECRNGRCNCHRRRGLRPGRGLRQTEDATNCG